MKKGLHNLNTIVYQKGGVLIHRPKEIVSGTVLYGQVLGTSGVHKVRKKRTGKNRFTYRCDCEYNFYREQTCKHIAAFVVAESEIRGAKGAKS